MNLIKKFITFNLAVIIAVAFSSTAFSAARGSGSFTTGKLSLYKVAAREEPGWLTDSSSSINNNFEILVATLTAMITGTLTDFTTNYVRTVPGVEQTSNANISSMTANQIYLDQKLEGPSGTIQASMLQGGNTSYILNASTAP